MLLLQQEECSNLEGLLSSAAEAQEVLKSTLVPDYKNDLVSWYAVNKLRKVEVGVEVGVEVAGWAWEARTRGPLGSSSVPPA